MLITKSHMLQFKEQMCDPPSHTHTHTHTHLKSSMTHKSVSLKIHIVSCTGLLVYSHSIPEDAMQGYKLTWPPTIIVRSGSYRYVNGAYYSVKI